MAIIELQKVSKIYGSGDASTLALKNINLKIEGGEFWSIMGPSGSGKSTLLNILGCMDRPTEGSYILKGQDISDYNANELSTMRNKVISFVFQNFALLNDYSVYDNIVLPLNCRRMSIKEKKERAKVIMEKLGIEALGKKKPTQISGGQQQRVAIARALISEPDILLADEPTGALDRKNGEELMKILKDINDEGTTVIVVTHDEKVAAVANKRLYIEDGECRVQ